MLQIHKILRGTLRVRLFERKTRHGTSSRGDIEYDLVAVSAPILDVMLPRNLHHYARLIGVL
jgi:hypothetical protein